MTFTEWIGQSENVVFLVISLVTVAAAVRVVATNPCTPP